MLAMLLLAKEDDDMAIRVSRDGYKQLKQRGTWRDRESLYTAIFSGDNFDSGHMHGRKISPDYPSTMHDDFGVLDKEWREKIVRDQPDYIVYSYLTPIAWHYMARDDDRYDGERHMWVIPEERYSNTTSRHQGFARTALAFADYEHTVEASA